MSPKLLGAPPIYRTFADWVLVCDNTRRCVARYVAADDRFQGPAYLSVTRGAGPEGEPSVALAIRENEPPLKPADLRLDGRRLDTYPWKLIDTKSADSRALLDGQAAFEFLYAVKNGGRLALADNAAAPNISLVGLKAALLAMDEAQGRLDTRTALEASGQKPPSDVPPAPPVPIVYAKPAKSPLPSPKALAAKVHVAKASFLEAHECDLDLARYDQAFALGDSEVLVALGCDIGAYNKSMKVFIASRRLPQAARLLIFPLQPGADPKIITEASAGNYVWGDWNASTATFTQLSEYRGLADCGARSAWTFDGRSFQLTHYDKLERCGGGPEGDWPTLYRTRVVVK